MEKIKLAIVNQRAVKYNKVVRRIVRDNNLHAQYLLQEAETALEKALLGVSTIGYIGIIWTGSLIDKIIVGDSILEIA